MSNLIFDNVTLKFGGITALNKVSFEVNPGRLFAIIGPNGAGKTSIFNSIGQYFNWSTQTFKLWFYF
jgi:branched-chain amino acid transport system ATP-binding protein